MADYVLEHLGGSEAAFEVFDDFVQKASTLPIDEVLALALGAVADPGKALSGPETAASAAA
jgi:hypothetical protein